MGENGRKDDVMTPIVVRNIIYFLVTFYAFSMDRLLLEFNCKETFF